MLPRGRSRFHTGLSWHYRIRQAGRTKLNSRFSSETLQSGNSTADSMAQGTGHRSWSEYGVHSEDRKALSFPFYVMLLSPARDKGLSCANAKLTVLFVYLES